MEWSGHWESHVSLEHTSSTPAGELLWRKGRERCVRPLNADHPAGRQVLKLSTGTGSPMDDHMVGMAGVPQSKDQQFLVGGEVSISTAQFE